MSAPKGIYVIEGRVGRRTSNALQMTFHKGPGDPFAQAAQGAGDGRGKKIGTLFGFKNGGVGNHILTYAKGEAPGTEELDAILNVASKDGKPTVLTRGDGVEVATMHRGDTSTAVLPQGEELFRFVPDPDEAKSVDIFRLIITTPVGDEFGRLQVVRRNTGWTLARAADAAIDTWLYPYLPTALPIPILGTRLATVRPIDGVERDVLLGVCVDIAIGLRPYIAAMN